MIVRFFLSVDLLTKTTYTVNGIMGWNYTTQQYVGVHTQNNEVGMHELFIHFVYHNS